MAEKFNFNKGLSKLEEIINKMDSGELSLEESLKYFEEGVKIHSIIESICNERNIGFGKVGQPFRLTLSGDGKSGSIDKCAQFVGKNRTLARLKKAIAWINSQNN